MLPILWLLGGIWLVVAVASAQGEQTGGITMSARAGFDGFYKTEFWLPVQVTVANSGPTVEGTLRVNVGSGISGDLVTYDHPISLPTQSNKRVTLFIAMPRFASMLVVVLLDQNGQVIHQVETNRLHQVTDGLLYGLVSPAPGAVGALERANGGRSAASVAFLDITELPPTPAAWNALDALVFDDVDTEQLTAEQRQALQGWVNTGGQLVVTGGAGWQKTAAALANLLPVTINGSQTVADLPSLSAHAGVPFRDPGPYLVATSSLRAGELLIHQDGLPLLARRNWGRGSVYFLALDPKLAPLLDWQGSEQVWTEVATRVPALPPWGLGGQNGYAAATAVSSIPSLSLPSALQLLVFLLIYVIIIGPVNYVVLRRFNRRELAWATIPVIVLFFTALAYTTGFQLKGNEVIVNQMSVAYGQAGAEQMRVQSFIGLYSPRRRAYDLILPGDTAVRPFGREFGSLGGGGNLGAVSRNGDVRLRDIRVDVSGTETFVADSYQPALAVTGQASLSTAGSSIRLNVQLQNNSNVTLEQASLLFGTTAFPLGSLGPGQSRQWSEVVGTAPAGASGGTPLFTPGSAPGSPLTGNATVILGGSNYYDDRELFPRWQLLQALEGNFSPASSTAAILPTDVVTLIAWSDQKQLDVTLDRSFSSLGTTLYFIELPLNQNITSGNNISIPALISLEK